MRKFIFLVAFFLSTMSLGVNVPLVHAQSTAATTTISASDTAEMNQTLLGLQERLLLLQAEAGAQPAVQQSSSVVSQSVTQMQAFLSAQDIASLSTALSALTNALASLNQTLAANQGSLTPGESASIASLLGGMTNELAMISKVVTGGASILPQIAMTNPTPVAVAMPSVPAVVTQPTVAQPTQAVATTTNKTSTAATNLNQNQVAVASQSTGGFQWPWWAWLIVGLLAIVVIITVALRKDDTTMVREAPKKHDYQAPKTQQANPAPTMSQPVSAPKVESQQTPMSSVVGSSVQNPQNNQQNSQNQNQNQQHHQ